MNNINDEEGEKSRCDWVPPGDDLYIKYHDEEWGTPVLNDRKLFEFLILEGMQAGLSWRTILSKRDNYRLALDDFDPGIIAQYGDDKISGLLENAGLIRNRLKIRSIVTNAQSFLRVVDEFGSFRRYIWGFVGDVPKQSERHELSEIPARTEESDKMSRDMKKRGFKFVGSTICYAFMQATGLVNDHQIKCFRHKDLL